MFAVQLPYYPTLTAHGYLTRYGIVEIDTPTIYDSPIVGRTLARVDTLYQLEDIFGHAISLYRDSVYGMISGQMSDQVIKRTILKFYRTLPKFRSVVNEKYHYAEPGEDLCGYMEKYILDTYRSRVEDLTKVFSECHAKELVQTHAYVYYSLHKVSKLPEVKGVTMIC